MTLTWFLPLLPPSVSSWYFSILLWRERLFFCRSVFTCKLIFFQMGGGFQNISKVYLCSLIRWNSYFRTRYYAQKMKNFWKLGSESVHWIWYSLRVMYLQAFLCCLFHPEEGYLRTWFLWSFPCLFALINFFACYKRSHFNLFFFFWNQGFLNKV